MQHTWINHDTDLVDLTLTTVVKGQTGRGNIQQSEIIHTNKKHPFLTKEKGFLPVGQIKLGMHVLRADGQWGMVTGWKVVAGTQVMYNLEVARDHTFTVGVGEWVVHNDCGPGDAGSYKDLSSQGTPGDNLEAHHMPQASLGDYFGYTRDEGGAIVMDKTTHSLTFSYGSRAAVVKQLTIDQGLTFRQALAQAIWDYRGLVPNSNSSIRALIRYWWDARPDLMQKPPSP